MSHVNARETQSWTLHHASRYGYLNLAQLLIDRSADVNAQLGDCWTALKLAFYDGHHQIADRSWSRRFRWVVCQVGRLRRTLPPSIRKVFAYANSIWEPVQSYHQTKVPQMPTPASLRSSELATVSSTVALALFCVRVCSGVRCALLHDPGGDLSSEGPMRYAP
jgi:Ankyrin repeats (many copies)